MDRGETLTRILILTIAWIQTTATPLVSTTVSIIYKRKSIFCEQGATHFSLGPKCEYEIQTNCKVYFNFL